MNVKVNFLLKISAGMQNLWKACREISRSSYRDALKKLFWNCSKHYTDASPPPGGLEYLNAEVFTCWENTLLIHMLMEQKGH